MLTKNGDKFVNAETDIDLVNNTINFKYPNEQYANTNLSFFAHNFFVVIGFAFGGVFSVMMCSKLIILWELNTFPETVKLLYVSGFTLFVMISAIGGIAFFGYISLLIHKFSRTARDAFPKTNAIIKRLMLHDYLIDLSKKYSESHFIDNNTCYFFDYDIILTEYKYLGKNRLLKVKTEHVGEKDDKIPIRFIMKFIFENEIKEGLLLIRA